jgi:hypothetical protein
MLKQGLEQKGRSDYWRLKKGPGPKRARAFGNRKLSVIDGDENHVEAAVLRFSAQ